MLAFLVGIFFIMIVLIVSITNNLLDNPDLILSLLCSDVGSLASLLAGVHPVARVVLLDLHRLEDQVELVNTWCVG